MKSILFFTALCFTACNTSAPQQPNAQPASKTVFQTRDTIINRIDENGLRQGHWLITGRIKQDPAYAPDAKVEDGDYKDNCPTGTWTMYYPDVKTKSEITYDEHGIIAHIVLYNDDQNNTPVQKAR